jgi:hypothetical protein
MRWNKLWRKLKDCNPVNSVEENLIKKLMNDMSLSVKKRLKKINLNKNLSKKENDIYLLFQLL